MTFLEGEEMAERRYYSMRAGKDPGRLFLDLPALRKLMLATYRAFALKDYFQQAEGYQCVDAGDVPGTMGEDPETYALLHLRKEGLYPINTKADYSEEDIFDLIEFLYDHVSKPLKGDYHSWNDCGWHWETFDINAGRAEFRAEINSFLRDYSGGWELSDTGEILAMGDRGLENLFEASLPSLDLKNVSARVEAAMHKYRRYRSSMEDRRDAVRSLADVLEFLRPQLKDVLTKKDEADLFTIANRFGIRHHDTEQQTDYDPAIWLSWMFYYYLATIHAATRLIAKYHSTT